MTPILKRTTRQLKRKNRFPKTWRIDEELIDRKVARFCRKERRKWKVSK